MTNQFFRPASSPQDVWTYGGFWIRVVAYLIDSIVIWALLALLGLLLVPPSLSVSIFDQQPIRGSGGDYRISYIQPADYTILSTTPHLHWNGNGVFELVSLLLPAAYFIVCEASTLQATPGKIACRMRVTDLYGNRITLLRAAGRYFGKYLSALILGFGFLMVMWTQRKQGLHDILAGTCVIRREARAVAPPPPQWG
ncbi:RDD family protein [Komagataeibacter kakiaceti JCM 25156]|uniref:RDD family protein n=1 Tax=Komagataeibacter TaxID=1434011 RepID=UPI000471CBF6|nr:MULTISPECIES: RDD family protein [Komagataeibacter]MCE2575419.1 RDD family protein [Komagataeibacter sp. FNDCR2]